MARHTLSLLLLALLSVSGCTTVSDAFNAMNPFSSSGPKMAELKPIETRLDVTQSWATSIGKAGEFVFVPAIVGNTVYAAAQNGTVNKLEDGKTIWKIDAGEPLSAGVGTDGKLVVVGTPNGEVLAFSAEDGKRLWKARVSSKILASPVVGPAGVAVRANDNQVFLLDAGDGGRKWAYQPAAQTFKLYETSSPVFADRYLLAGFPGGKLIALALQNGAPVWEGTVALPKGSSEPDRLADVAAPPVVEGSQICAVAYQGRVACFDLNQGGAQIWARDMSSARGLVLDGRYLFVTDEKGIVHALDRLSGSSLWKQDKLLHRKVTAPMVRRGVVVVADAEGVVHFLARDDGSFVARFKTDGTPVKTPVRSIGSAFLVQTSGGNISVIEAQ